MMSPHGIRHSGGSLAYARNPGNIKVISQRLRHKDVTTTANIYLHISPDQHRDLATSISDVLDAEPAPESSARDTDVTHSADR
jgi:integrase